MPIAHLLELWKGIEVEPMETEVSSPRAPHLLPRAWRRRWSEAQRDAGGSSAGALRAGTAAYRQLGLQRLRLLYFDTCGKEGLHLCLMAPCVFECF
uniref:Uncharacterized protein n=1 Tax=Coturnix japonica TaxID=93934 RepID=A0A8C2SYK5_COTJA